MDYLNFFFSSRRRHTIFKCDWSSDVCSSDLTAEVSANRAFDIARILHVERLIESQLAANGRECLRVGLRAGHRDCGIGGEPENGQKSDQRKCDPDRWPPSETPAPAGEERGTRGRPAACGVGTQ